MTRDVLLIVAAFTALYFALFSLIHFILSRKKLHNTQDNTNSQHQHALTQYYFHSFHKRHHTQRRPTKKAARLTSASGRELIEEAGLETGPLRRPDEDVAGVAAVLHLRVHVVVGGDHGGVGRLLGLSTRHGAWWAKVGGEALFWEYF